MQNILRNVLIFFLVVYDAIAIVNPERIYIDRFLFNMTFWEWIPYQVFPSMYSTEILVKKSCEKLTSTAHHPIRIFFETKNHKGCDTTMIFVKYRNVSKMKNIEFCNNKIKNITGSSNLQSSGRE